MIVGLSNPKKKYHNTRHNAGSWYIYSLIKYHSNILKEDKKFLGFTSFLNIMSNNIKVFIPNIFMNINGYAIYKIAFFYKIRLSEILVIHDDLDLKPGIIKFKYSYGHSGHNGLRSIINEFHNQKINFYRFRIGIGRPINKNEISSFVLSPPSHSEMILIKKSILDAIKENYFFKSI
ncbi:aminoacyl-tRNA hydrolase [Buchnera aphidicola (Melanaphis sacchari)]|uniref:Peptidyl-tRNA hydrolase n=1 Tax=Buchnera aphidicola (Melanaphis sacchari) TaxID=2173854 RepID=A0A2U8DH18_9GAMM|nr:aminoacyl-tRNA hydrolase [Buchnera aphidicola]AWH90771.1 aminoacyl-tRNA hydrolase [Buchnera aphidicola (Melanaphis sacchari)]